MKTCFNAVENLSMLCSFSLDFSRVVATTAKGVILKNQSNISGRDAFVNWSFGRCGEANEFGELKS